MESSNVREMQRITLLAALAALTLGLGAAVAGAAPLPGVKKPSDRQAWLSLLHWAKGCESDWRSTPAASSASGIDISAPIADGNRLVQVACYFGAYQGTTIMYLVNPGRHVTGPLAFSIYIDPGSGKPTLRKETEILGDTMFDSKSGSLSVFDKARGIGDCGIYSTFKLTDDRFVPVVVRAKLACNGKPPFDPTLWPKLRLPS
jgi:hypothetical protein